MAVPAVGLLLQAAVQGLSEAFALLTALPVAAWRRDAGVAPKQPGPVVAFFPVAGLVVGGLQALAWEVSAALWPRELAALCALAAGILATRGLHWDGWMDCCDAFMAAHRSREERLAILHDSRVGAFGALGGTGMLLAWWAAAARLSSPAAQLAAAAVVSRWAMGLAVCAFPAARQQGMAAWLRRRTRFWEAAAASVAAAVAVLAIAGVQGLILMGPAFLVALACGTWAARLLGGLSGDVYGAVQVLSETACLWVWVAAVGRAAGGR